MTLNRSQKQVLSQRAYAWQNHHRSNHTTSYALAGPRVGLKPKRLVLYHVLVFGLEDSVVLEEVQSRYDGEVVLASDPDVFDVTVGNPPRHNSSGM